MTGLAQAVERKDWTVVALYLLLGVSQAAEKLPPETLEALIDLLGGEEALEALMEVDRHGDF